MFILLIWIPHLKNEVSSLNKYIYVNYQLSRKSDSRTYRFLEKYKQDENSNVVMLRDNIPNNKMKKKKNISNNEKECSRKKKQSNRGSSNNSRGNKQDLNNNSCIFVTNKYSFLEKKIFKEHDYIDFPKNNKHISDKFYKKIMSKKFSLRLSLPLLMFLLLSTVLIVDVSLYLSSGENRFFNLSGLEDISCSWSDNLKPYFVWLLDTADNSKNVLAPLFSVILYV
ncbi:Plasmodium exported protein (Pm-fam-a like), unknown function, partial [Plasmodium malariae]